MTKQIQTRKTFHNEDLIRNIYERLNVFHVMKPCKFYLSVKYYRQLENVFIKQP